LSTPHAAHTDPSSTDDSGEGGGDPGSETRRFVLAMRVLAGLSALLSLAALWSVEARQLRHDLQLAAASSARPGDLLALRGLIFRDVDALAGPTLALAPTTVRLLDDKERELAKVALHESALTTLDGSLRLPSGLSGTFALEAQTHFEGGELTCRRLLLIEPEAPRVQALGREAGALQQFSLGHLRPRGDGSVPSQVLARVVGGACVPETPCRVLVWMGEPAAALRVRVEATASLTTPPTPQAETAGLVEFELLVHAPDAQITLEILRGGSEVAERALRLPVGLAEVALRSSQSLVEPDSMKFSYVAPPGRDELTFDIFADQQWSYVGTRAAAGAPFTLPPELSATGLLRVQGRGDRLSGGGAGARVVYLRAPGEDDLHALSALAGLVAKDPDIVRSATDSWARELPPFAAMQPQQTAAFLLAALEEHRAPVPPAVSGRPAQLSRLDHTRSLFRYGVAGALVLSAGVIGLSIARRGLLAADEAEVILEQARGDAGRSRMGRSDLDEVEGAPGPDEGRVARPRDLLGARLRVVLLALAVAAAFLAAALLIAAKPLWF